MAEDKIPYEELTKEIFYDLMTIVTENIVMEVHRTEKLTNMGYFATVGVPALEEFVQHKDDPDLLSAMAMGRSLKLPIEDEICPKCHLPRQTPEQNFSNAVGKKFCPKPFIRREEGLDVYGKPIVFGKKKKADEDKGTPIVEDRSQVTVKDPNNVRVGCINGCNTDPVASRFSAHLEKCMGFSGRLAATRNKGQGTNNGSNSGTPYLSADSPNSSVEGDESYGNKKNSKKAAAVSDDKKPLKKKAAPKKEKERFSTPTGTSTEKSTITSAPRMEKSLSTLSARADSPTPSVPGSQSKNNTESVTKKKKLKRKAENIDDDDDKKSSLDVYDIDNLGSSKEKAKESNNITPTKPLKKQKTSSTPSSNHPSGETARGSPLPATPTTKNLVTKFKDRAGSPTPTKKDKLGSIDLNRTDSSVGRKSSPKPSNSDSKESIPKLKKPPLGASGSPNTKNTIKGGPASSTKLSKKDGTPGKNASAVSSSKEKKKEKLSTPDNS